MKLRSLTLIALACPRQHLLRLVVRRVVERLASPLEPLDSALSAGGAIHKLVHDRMEQPIQSGLGHG